MRVHSGRHLRGQSASAKNGAGKGQFRDLLSYYDLWGKTRLLYGGLVELIVNAMVDVKPGFIEWEWH
jgi:hypothetical protein